MQHIIMLYTDVISYWNQRIICRKLFVVFTHKMHKILYSNWATGMTAISTVNQTFSHARFEIN